jgi:drug/metabolite transporter (DMT)-like permease
LQTNSIGFGMKKLTSVFLGLYFFFASAVANSVFAQSDDDIVKSTQNDIMLVGVAGVAGAVLGLSTLSFADEPSKHVSNIWTGGALGIIAGVIFVAYNSAQKGSEDLQSSSEFNSSERVAWHSKNTQSLTLPSVQFGTQIWQTNF